MEIFGKIIHILDAQMTEPTLLGWFHIVFFILPFLAAYLLCRRHKTASEEFVRRFLLIVSLIVIGLEIYKQFNYSFTYEDGVVSFGYQWYIFPFQFCSTPMYVGLLAALISNKRVHNALCAYLATFSVFAGLVVMIYPEQVFIETIGVNIQSMICHGSMITIGIYLLYTGYVKLEHKTILKAVPVFGICVVIAVILNEIAYYVGLLENHKFNMFYVSPHLDPHLPVYCIVQEILPYPLDLFVYIGMFTLAGYVILLIGMGIKSLSMRISKKD